MRGRRVGSFESALLIRGIDSLSTAYNIKKITQENMFEEYSLKEIHSEDLHLWLYSIPSVLDYVEVH